MRWKTVRTYGKILATPLKTKYLVILRYSLGIIASLFKQKLKGFRYVIIMAADKKSSKECLFKLIEV